MVKDGLVAHVDNDLVRRTREGDVTAFEELFARHQRRVYNICLQILSDEAEAADVTQDVFVRAYKSIKNLKSDAAFVVWLKTLTVNMCRDVLRKRVRTPGVQSLDKMIETNDGDCLQREIEDWSHNPERTMDKRETCEIVQSAISSLSPDYREVVTLFYVDGAEVNDIAKTLNSPVGTIKSRLARARAELKRKLAHLLET